VIRQIGHRAVGVQDKDLQVSLIAPV